MGRFIFILLSAAALLSSGCATLSKDECLAADWRTIGFEDGSRGYASSRIGQHREACADYGVAPNLSHYQEGHSEGAEVYCAPNNGFEVGRRGATYNGICSARMEEEFLLAFGQGKEIYQLWVAADAMGADIANAYKEIDYHQERADANRQMSRAAWERKQYDEARSLDEEADEHLKSIGRLEGEILDMEAQKAAFEADAERLEASYRPYYR